MFYMSEVQNKNSYRKAIKLEAQSLTNAKRESTRKQVFNGTLLIISDRVNKDGCIDMSDAIAVKDDGKWKIPYSMKNLICSLDSSIFYY